MAAVLRAAAMAERPARLTWRRHGPVLGLAGVVLLADAGIGLAAPLWAVRVRELGQSPAFLGVAVGFVGLARLATAATAGAMSDRVGRRGMLVAALGLLVVAALGTALTPWAGALLALRLLEGAGWEAMNVVGVAYVADRVRDDPYRGRIMAMYNGARRGTQSAAPALGGLIAIQLGVPIAFVVYAALAAAAAALAAGALAGARRGSVRRTGFGALGSVGREPAFRALGLVGIVSTGADLAFQQHLVPTLGQDRGLSEAQIGVALSAYGVALISSSLLGGWLVDRYGAQAATVAGTAVAAIGYGLVAPAIGFGAIAAAMAVAGFGRGIAGPGPNVLLLDLFPDRQGAAQGAFRSVNGLGRALVPPLAGAVASAHQTLAVGLVAAALGGSAVALAMARVGGLPRGAPSVPQG